MNQRSIDGALADDARLGGAHDGSESARDAYTVLPNCTACGACLQTCPERCIRVADRGLGVPLVVLEEQCTGCGECAEICPAEAIIPLAELGS